MTKVIAEIGISHAGSPERAAYMIREAAEQGVWGVKFQMCVPALLFRDKATIKKIASYMLPMRALKRLRAEADRLGLAWGASAFDNPSVDDLEKLKPDFQKVACGQDWGGMRRLDCMQIQSYTRGMLPDRGTVPLLCVPKYPASLHDYLPIPRWARGISDHTGAVNGGALARGLDYAEVHVMDRIDVDVESPDNEVSIPVEHLGAYRQWTVVPAPLGVSPRTSVELRRPIRGQRLAWLRGAK